MENRKEQKSKQGVIRYKRYNKSTERTIFMFKKILMAGIGLALLAAVAIAIWTLTNPNSPAHIVADEAPTLLTGTPPATGNDEHADYAEECPIAFWEERGLDADMMQNQSRALITAEYIYDMFPGTGWPPAYPDYFGGLYLNDDGNLVVLIVESYAGSDDVADFLNRVQNAGGAIVRYVEFSMSKLLSIQDTLIYYFDRDHPASRVLRGSGLDTVANRVNVYMLSHSDDDMALFRSEIANSPAIVFHNVRTEERRPSPPLRVHPPLEDTGMAVTSIDQDNGKVVVTIYNDSPYLILTGYPFSLEVYDNGWWIVPSHAFFILPAFDVRPGGSIDFTKDLMEHAGQMAPGLYRIRKDVFRDIDTPINDGNVHDIVAEFIWE